MVVGHDFQVLFLAHDSAPDHGVLVVLELVEIFLVLVHIVHVLLPLVLVDVAGQSSILPVLLLPSVLFFLIH